MDDKKNIPQRHPFTKDKHGIKRLFFNPSTMENIDQSVFNYLDLLNLFSTTNKGWTKVPVVWSTAERSFQAKREEEIRELRALKRMVLKDIIGPIDFHIKELEDQLKEEM